MATHHRNGDTITYSFRLVKIPTPRWLDTGRTRLIRRLDRRLNLMRITRSTCTFRD